MPKGVHNGHVRGRNHPNFQGYVYQDKGYPRYTAHHPKFPTEFVHRVVTKVLAQEGFCYHPLDSTGFPYVVGEYGEIFAMEVHHQDWNRRNCCPANLLLLDHRLHDAHNHNGRERDERGRWISRAVAAQRAVAQQEWEFEEATRDAPDWVTEELEPGLGASEEREVGEDG